LSASTGRTLGTSIAADKLGFFKEEGLQVEVSAVTSGAVGIPALVGGSVEFAISNIVSIVLAGSQGLDVKVIAGNADTGPESPDTSAVVVKADSPIKGAADLAGKRLAVNAIGSLNWLYGMAWLEKAGVDAKSVTMPEVPFPQMNDAVVNGQADAAFGVDPFVARGVAAGTVRVIGQPMAETQDNVLKSLLVTTGALTQSKPEVVKGFVRAYKRGVQWMNEHRGTREWAEMVAAITEVKPEIIMKAPQPRFPAEVSVDDARETVALMAKLGVIEKEIDFNDLVYKTPQS
jgi:NitT/TauT family transport system substrate-binding protein